MHVFFNKKHDGILDFYVDRLEVYTEYLFAICDTRMGIASMDHAAIRAYTGTTRKFVEQFLEDVTTKAAFKPRRGT